MMKVAINGLGRIGRATFKLLVNTPSLELVAINDLTPVDNLVYLLNHDTIYGRYPNRAKAEQDAITMADRRYYCFSEHEPCNLPWSHLGIDVVFECSGRFNTRKALSKHIDAGAKRVILSTLAVDEDIPTVIYGVNAYDEKTGPILSCASCTMNCVGPILEIIDRHLGLQKAMTTTTQAYTSDQALVDAPHKNKRRGRAAGINIVPSTTGAAMATLHALPNLKGRFQGSAVGVPVPICSLSDIVMLTEQKTHASAVNDIFLTEARGDRYAEVLGITEDPIVSSDIIQDSRASIVDADLTQVVDGNLLKVMSWQDNEWGYASQMVRQAVSMALIVPVER